MRNGETMQTPSSRLESGSGHGHGHGGHKRSIGCMSGIFQFLSRHHNHSRKRLTSAPKRVRTAVISPSKQKPSPAKRSLSEEDNEVKKRDGYLAVSGARTCETPRSPTIPQEIRRSTAGISPDSPRPAPAIVARLMGLEEAAPPPDPLESAAEKRRKLLGALEKCDEDLKTLRRIIEAVRLAEIRVKASDALRSDEASKGRFESDGPDLKSEVNNAEQPSPNSVLDAISSPRFRSKRSESDKRTMSASSETVSNERIVKPSRVGVFFLGHEHCRKTSEIAMEKSRLHPLMEIEGLPRNKDLEESGAAEKRKRWAPRRRSEAMAESVEEVWEDGEWEEKWEVGRIAVGLECDIFRDLVGEVIVELFACSPGVPLALKTCRKMLLF
ncbi:uncharacterized protein [Typha latifolia]|uniref:uncharacterized protein n=1 Tax=Typha latifolia TaxID=4733 RepID=UPI003C2D5BF0